MIRTKAKSLLLSCMLLLACFCFWGCKEKTKVGVDSISFTEQSITMLVGEEYTPTIKLLPSYATDRSYKLVSYSTALKVEGGTIIALEGMLDVKLKVVSNENPNVNDIITVDIYEQAKDLDAPTELRFDGDKLVFVGRDNANSYMLKVNGQEINIGNNTEYSFASVVEKMPNLYNEIITCSVKAIGDGKVFNDSTYGQEISIVKLSSVTNAYVQNETLYFNAIKNIKSYDINVVKLGNIVATKTITNPSFDVVKLSLDIRDLADGVDGAEYVLNIKPNISGYKFDNVSIFEGLPTELEYNVVGSVKNVTISERVISWPFVKNAQNYTVDIYKDNERLQRFESITSNSLKLPYEDAGEYYCVVLANSNKENTTTGKEFSQPLYFNILSAPEVVANNNQVYWQEVEGSDGYLVTIKNRGGATLVDKTLILQNYYDVSEFVAGTYSIQVVANASANGGVNGEVLLSSAISDATTWTILNGLQLRVKNGTLYWQDLDINSKNKYRITFGEEVIDLPSADYYEEMTAYGYNLLQHEFEAGNHIITIQSVGEGNVFDAKINSTNIIKLADSSIDSLIDKKFTINTVSSASRYTVEIFKSTDLANPIRVLEDKISGNKFAIDDATLEAGNYVAKVLVYGNGTNVFDADNLMEGTTFPFEKLPTPEMFVDEGELKLVIEDIARAQSYKLYQNNSIKPVTDREYSLSDLPYVDNKGSGCDYIYKVQALGNGLEVLDSDCTLEEDQIKVRKLHTPEITFRKESLAYHAETSWENRVGDEVSVGCKFLINGIEIYSLSDEYDCSNVIVEPGNYIAEAHLYPSSSSGGEYDLILQSDVAYYNYVNKLAGDCSFQISNGVLIVTPDEHLTGGGYSLELTIGDAIVLNDFTYINSRFQKNLYDSKYNVIEEILPLLIGVGQYSVKTVISSTNNNLVSSNVTICEKDLKILGKVQNINKKGQNIEFGIVEGATNYIAIVDLYGNETTIDLAGRYTTDTTNVISIEDFKTLMQMRGVSYLEQTPYTIKIVAVNEDSTTIANKGNITYTFEFLKTPTLSVTELEGTNTKYLQIYDEDINISRYNVAISQTETIYNEQVVKTAQDTLINMDEIDGLVAGNIEVKVNSTASSGNYFDSGISTINIIKSNSETITVVDGKLQWNSIASAKQYNLWYFNQSTNNQPVVVNLYQGVENFTTYGGVCIYEFDELESGISNFYLQVDTFAKLGNTYYINSDNGETLSNIYKLPTIETEVVNGEIYAEVRTLDYARSNNLEVLIDGKPLDIDVTQAENENIKLVTTMEKISITIAPGILFKYGDSEMLKETISLRLYSDNALTLNSSVSQKDIYGLLKPTGLDITTSITQNESGVINEVLEKITWNNPTGNGQYVSKYEIVVNYKNVNYIFNTTEHVFMMPTYCDYDANENGELDYNEDINGNNQLDAGEDINGNGILDRVEVVFGSGVYNIKVRALTDNCDNIVNSKYCEEIQVTVLETPKNLETKDGNISWSSDTNVEYYLIKVYLIENGEPTLMVANQTTKNVSEFDLCSLTPFETGVYGVSIQAMHNNSRILSSKESEILQVIRLPQVNSYRVVNGELYISAHAFYSKAEIYLVNKDGITLKEPFVIYNNSLGKYNSYTSATGFKWSDSNIIETYTDENYYVAAKYEGSEGPILRAALAEGYKLKIKLYGNSTSKGAIISGHTNTEVINMYWAYDNTIENEDKNRIEKLVTLNIKVSETERGVMLINCPEGIAYSLKYFINGENSLQGVHLYQIILLTDKSHSFLVADIVDETLFNNSLEAVGATIIQDTVERNYLKHFEYAGNTFNIIDKNAKGFIPFDLTTNYYYYYTLEGVYQEVKLYEGGSFIMCARFIGDDTQFVYSNTSNLVKIERYSPLNVTVSNGSISWKNLTTDDNHPIYVITLTNSNETYNLVLYNSSMYTEEDLKGCLDSSKQYIFDAITYQTGDEVITYTRLADIIYKARQDSASALLSQGGTFLATIKAQYTNSSSMDVILAQGGDSVTVSILPQASIIVTDGCLTWNMAFVNNSNGDTPVNNYRLEIYDGDNKLYQINLGEDDYILEGRVAIYNLPEVINNGADGEFKFVPGVNYTFKLIALGADSSTYVDSVATSVSEVDILPVLQDVKMEDGKLTWINTTTNSVEIYVTYPIKDAFGNVTALVELEFKDITSNSFELPATHADISNTSRELIAGYDYYIKLRLKGTNNSLNGFYVQYVDIVNRLDTVPTNSIVTNNGILTWEANAKPETTYTITYCYELDSDGKMVNPITTEKLANNVFDFTNCKEGSIYVSIQAHNNNHFNSFTSDIVELFKLSVPTNIVYYEGSTTISWDEVLDKDGNPVEAYIVKVMQEGREDQEFKCETNEWVITGVDSTAFEISVQAISESATGTLLNSDYSAPANMEVPNQVDVNTFKFDEELQAFKWRAIEGEQENSDEYYISYNYYELNSNVLISSNPEKVTISKIIQTEDGEEKWYYYYPSVIGTYRMINVQVKRAGSLSSQQTWCINEDGTNYELDFDIFEAGAGTSKNPYIISNEQQLRNIKYFLNGYYELDRDISLSSNAPITTSEQVFTGTITGGEDKHYIIGVKQTDKTMFTNYVGLFNVTENATFANIRLSNFGYNGYVNSGTLYMGVLVGYAEGTNFNNITITSTSINVIKNRENGYTNDSVNVYIGAIAGYVTNSTITNCVVNLGGTEPNVILNITGNSRTKFALGGIVGYANITTITNNTSGEDINGESANAFIILKNITADGNAPTLYIGALVGEIVEDGITSNGNSLVYLEHGSTGNVVKNNETGN